MKKILSALLLLSASCVAVAQTITQPPSGDNQKSSVTQWIGPISVTINYNSPDVHAANGEDRKGHIWGELVHYGFIDQGYGSSKAAPWRAGANENTTITFSHPVTIGGKEVKAGTYGLFLDVEKSGTWNWILSNKADDWGSYYYNAKEDALRAATSPVDAAYTEWLTYGFEDRLPNSAVAYLQWENKKIPMKIEVPNINQLYVDIIRKELYATALPASGMQESWVSAANFCVRNKINLEEALTWANTAITDQFFGQQNFNTLSTKANVLMALGRNEEANKVMDQAIEQPTASVQAIHQYGRQLLAAGNNAKALQIFQYNFKKHPEEKFTTYVGLARGYTATGDKKNAIKNWEVAIKNLPDDQKQNAALYEAEVKKLKEGK